MAICGAQGKKTNETEGVEGWAKARLRDTRDVWRCVGGGVCVGVAVRACECGCVRVWVWVCGFVGVWV